MSKKEVCSQCKGTGILSERETCWACDGEEAEVRAERQQEAEPVLADAPLAAINSILTEVMDIAVANGANSVSMPDEYVAVAAWLCGVKSKPPTCQRCAESIAAKSAEIVGLNADFWDVASERNQLQAKVAELTKELGLTKLALEARRDQLAQCESALTERGAELTRAEQVIEKCGETLSAVSRHVHQFVDVIEALTSINAWKEGRKV